MADSEVPIAGVVSRSEHAWKMLRAAIFNGRFPPGSPLRFQQVQAMCEMSASPVREALAKLVAEGLVEGEHNRGYRVTPLRRAELDDLVLTRIMLESRMLARSIELGSERWEVDLLGALHLLSRLARKDRTDPRLMDEEWNRRHAAFHAALMGGCDSPIQMRFCRQLYDRADRYRRLSLAVEREPRDIDGEHDAIARAALDRDAPRATTLLAEHYERTAAFLRLHLSTE